MYHSFVMKQHLFPAMWENITRILRVIGIQNPSNFDRIFDKLFSFLAETYLGGMRYLLDKAVNGEIEVLFWRILKTDLTKTAAVNLVVN